MPRRTLPARNLGRADFAARCGVVWLSEGAGLIMIQSAWPGDPKVGLYEPHRPTPPMLLLFSGVVVGVRGGKSFLLFAGGFLEIA